MGHRIRIAIGLGLMAAACHGTDGKADEDENAAASASEAPQKQVLPMPSGPRLAIEAGEGLGAIRFGATVATIERLMQRPCEVRTENLCRYVARGVDFHLLGGELVRVHVQRAGRPAGNDVTGKPLVFGFFNGGIRPDLALGMTPQAIQQYLGKPERIEPIPEPNPQNMVARDHYPGLVIEYDRFTNGNIIFAGAEVFKDPRVSRPDPPPAAQASAAPSAALSSAPAPSATAGPGASAAPRQPEPVH